MAVKVETVVVCPSCDNRGLFEVTCAEWVTYTWDGTQRPGLKWDRDGGCYDVMPVGGKKYLVQCRCCGHHWKSEPWA